MRYNMFLSENEWGVAWKDFGAMFGGETYANSTERSSIFYLVWCVDLVAEHVHETFRGFFDGVLGLVKRVEINLQWIRMRAEGRKEWAARAHRIWSLLKRLAEHPSDDSEKAISCY